MTEPIVTDYLLELSDALADVPRSTRVEILAGVREELEGLGEDEAAERIRSLGDPHFIAAGAREDVAAPSEAPEPQWRSTVAALLVMVGGVVIPFIGWIAGIALMWTSRAWSTRVKLLATVLPALGGLQVLIVTTIASLFETESVDETFRYPGLSEFENPLVPSFYDLVFTVPLWGLPSALVIGICLLVTANKPQRVTGSSAWGVIPVAVGSLVLPPVGWIVGLIFLWTSSVPARTKAVMTTVGPVALILGVALARVFTEEPVVLLAAAIAVPFLASLVAAVLLLRTPTAKAQS